MSYKYGYNNGDFGWNELAVDDPDKAVEFYTALFGWKVEKFPMPDMEYHVLINGPEKVAGIMAKPEQMGDAPSAWTPYVTVNDVDATAAKVVELGGSICVPPQDIPEVGRFTVLQDPCGAVLGAITYVPSSVGS